MENLVHSKLFLEESLALIFVFSIDALDAIVTNSIAFFPAFFSNLCVLFLQDYVSLAYIPAFFINITPSCYVCIRFFISTHSLRN